MCHIVIILVFLLFFNFAVPIPFSLNTQINNADLLKGQFPPSEPGLIRFSIPTLNLAQNFQLMQQPMLLTGNTQDLMQEQQDTNCMANLLGKTDISNYQDMIGF